MLIIKKPHPQIYLVTSESASELGKAFCRLQEMYESPSKLFRGKRFTLEKFKKWYCKNQSRNGRFTYYSDYFGFNVPGEVLMKFGEMYGNELSYEEVRLLLVVGRPTQKFYVIGAPEKSQVTIDHELSHAFWYLFPYYREYLTRLQEGHDVSGIERYLEDNMYRKEVFADEITAYLTFDEPILRRAGVSTKHLRDLQYFMRLFFDEYKKEQIEKREAVLA